MTFRTAFGLAACAFLFAALPAGAALFKWTDDNGRVVYGDTPPPGVKAERVNPAVAPSDPNAIRELAAKDAEFNKRQQDRQAEEAKAQKADSDLKAKLERCVQLRGRLQQLRGDYPVYRFNEAGQRIYFDDAERARAITEGEQQQRDLACPIEAG